MNIASFGGEFRLINAVKRPAKNKKVIKAAGDDCAVIKNGKNYTVITKDIMVDGDHFDLRYASARQTGIKAIESNVSDIAAMGARPLYALVGITLTHDTQAEWVKELYAGMYSRCAKHGIDIIGGDTTHSSKIMISITVLGEVAPKRCIFRSGAKPGELIFSTGKLGAAYTGYLLYTRGIKGHDYCKKQHLEPRCRLDAGTLLSRHAGAMIDVSDGLASEVKHIARESGCGAVLFKEKIPIDRRTVLACGELGIDPTEPALYGGEDYELVYTLHPKNIKKAIGYQVGVITEKMGVYLESRGVRALITRSGYDHFASSADKIT